MGSSGLIYAAIVAAWAAVLVPRWVRRNEEVEQAREVDLARGVRVLPGPGQLRRIAGSAVHHTPPPPHDDTSVVEAGDGHDSEFSIAAQRRRRVLMVLTFVLSITVTGSVAGRLPSWAVVVPVVLLAMFLMHARRAAVAEARRRTVARQNAARAVAAAPARRIAVLDKPEPAPPEDPDAWEPVPVPLPTYVTKAKAPDPGSRRIDLSQPGAWTSGPLDAAAWSELSRGRSAAVDSAPSHDVDDLPERRRAVGD